MDDTVVCKCDRTVIPSRSLVVCGEGSAVEFAFVAPARLPVGRGDRCPRILRALLGRHRCFKFVTLFDVGFNFGEAPLPCLAAPFGF